MNASLSISPRLRLGLAFKGVLLLGLGAVFAALLVRGLGGSGISWWVRLLSLGFALPAQFLGMQSLLAFADAWLGQAVEVQGARALQSRAAGHSLRLPDGHFAEYLLVAQWTPLVPERAYTVVIGRYSRVLVAPPRPEDEPLPG